MIFKDPIESWHRVLEEGAYTPFPLLFYTMSSLSRINQYTLMLVVFLSKNRSYSVIHIFLSVKLEGNRLFWKLQINGFSICGYYDRENLGCYYIVLIYWSACSSSRRGWVGSTIISASWREHFIRVGKNITQYPRILFNNICKLKKPRPWVKPYRIRS